MGEDKEKPFKLGNSYEDMKHNMVKLLGEARATAFMHRIDNEERRVKSF
jgi:hypothetical protein